MRPLLSIFLQSVGCLSLPCYCIFLLFLITVLACYWYTRVLNFDPITCFFLLLLMLWIKSKEPLPGRRAWRLSSEFYTLAFMFRSLIQWSSFFCVVWGKVQLHSFVSSCPSTIWTDLFPLRVLGHPCWKSVGVHMWVYFWALSSNPLISVSVLSQYYTVLINFVLGLKSGSVSPPTLFFFFEIILALRPPCYSM